MSLISGMIWWHGRFLGESRPEWEATLSCTISWDWSRSSILGLARRLGVHTESEITLMFVEGIFAVLIWNDMNDPITFTAFSSYILLLGYIIAEDLQRFVCYTSFIAAQTGACSEDECSHSALSTFR